MDGNLLPYHQREDGQRYFTNADMARMVELGMVDPEDRWELIRGEWFDMPSESYEHMDVRTLLHTEITLQLGRRPDLRINSEGSVFLFHDTELRPDLVVYRAGLGTNEMSGRDIFLIAEVMIASKHRDSVLKRPVYAAAGVPELWLIDLDRATITVLRDPREGDYRSETTLDADTPVSPLAFQDISIALAMLKSAC